MRAIFLFTAVSTLLLGGLSCTPAEVKNAEPYAILEPESQYLVPTAGVNTYLLLMKIRLPDGTLVEPTPLVVTVGKKVHTTNFPKDSDVLESTNILLSVENGKGTFQSTYTIVENGEKKTVSKKSVVPVKSN